MKTLFVDFIQVFMTNFRYTTQVMVAPNGEVSQSSCPVQVIFCRARYFNIGLPPKSCSSIPEVKEQNKKKLNSHRWFFNAFGPLINPNGAH
jgi:chitin synthase